MKNIKRVGEKRKQLSMLMSVSTSLISLWARDEYYRDQFEKVLMGAKL